MGQNLVPLVNLKIAGKWMFIPLKMVLIGIDPYPYNHLESKSHENFGFRIAWKVWKEHPTVTVFKRPRAHRSFHPATCFSSRNCRVTRISSAYPKPKSSRNRRKKQSVNWKTLEGNKCNITIGNIWNIYIYIRVYMYIILYVYISLSLCLCVHSLTDMSEYSIPSSDSIGKSAYRWSISTAHRPSRAWRGQVFWCQRCTNSHHPLC